MRFFLPLFLFFLIISSSAISQEKIVFVDMDRLVSVSKPGFSIFLDAANIWGIDYSSSLSDNSKIRSSVGIAVDFFTPIGPLNFSLTEAITKGSNDITESFRFNIGTTF